MSIKNLATIICLLLASQLGFGQTLKQFKKKAEEAFNNKNYYAALSHYATVVDADGDDIEAQYNFAEAARNYDAYTMAEQAYEKVADSSQAEEFPLTNFWLAGIKKNLGKYSEASNLYLQYIGANEGDDTEFILSAQKELKYLSWAAEVVDNPITNAEVKHLGPEINTPYSEIGPYNLDGELYYASFRFDNQNDDHYPFRPLSKVLSSKASQTGVLLEGDVNSLNQHSAHVSFNTNANKMYFSICNYVSETSTDIYCNLYSKDRLTDTTWSSSTKLPEIINAKGFSTTQPNIGYDKATGKEMLFFVSNREGGAGEDDIWYCSIEKDGSYTRPQALKALNTSGRDISPFYHSASSTLYFSTNGRKSLGGLDIYKSEKTAEGWETPEHLGYPINSSFNDLDYMLDAEETQAYFASNRIGSFYLEDSKEACCNDIYKVTLEEIFYDMKAITFNHETEEELLGVNVELSLGESLLRDDTNFDSNEHTLPVKRNKEYQVRVSKPGFEPQTITVSTDNIDVEEIVKEFYLKPYTMSLLARVFDEGSKFPLTGVTLQFLKCDLTEGSSETNDESNTFEYPVSPTNCYTIKVYKEGYMPKTIDINTEIPNSNKVLEENIYMVKLPPVTRLTLEEYLPLPLFFDNDQPDAKSTKSITRKTYQETYDSYVQKKNEFKKQFTKGLSGEQKTEAEYEVDKFFIEKVDPSKAALESFTAHLLRYLQQGNVAEIIIKGYTSPLAQKEYNQQLAKRRISSIRNHFAKYRDGIFADYIAKGQFKVSEAPFGELKANPAVSDDYRDLRNSVFSVSASFERRVEIIELK